jgi:hypothetical protein
MIGIIYEVINKSSTLLLNTNNTSTGYRHARGSQERHGEKNEFQALAAPVL